MNTSYQQYFKINGRGLTLIELLLGLTIFSVIALSLYGTFANGIKLNKKAQSMESYYQQAGSLLDIISRDLENMVDYRFADTEEGEARGSVSGELDRMSFLIPTDNGLKRVHYYLHEPDFESIHRVEVGKIYTKNVTVTEKTIEDEPVYFLLREISLFHDPSQGQDESSAVSREVISEHVKQGSLKFFYTQSRGLSGEETASWESSWSGPSLPAAVRVECILASEEEGKEELAISKNIFIPQVMWGQSLQ